MARKSAHSQLVTLIVKTSQTLPFKSRCSIVRNETGVSRRNGAYIQYGHVGWGDIIGIAHDGKFCSAEIKIDKDRLSEDQKEFRDTVQMLGGYWAEIRDLSSGIDWLMLISGLN